MHPNIYSTALSFLVEGEMPRTKGWGVTETSSGSSCCTIKMEDDLKFMEDNLKIEEVDLQMENIHKSKHGNCRMAHSC
jgi:hypothetical protein